MKVLVTGGSGLIGSALKRVKPNWIYLSSKDCNLYNKELTYKTLKHYSPDIIIHLAADVGGLFKNMNNKIDMFNNNLQINYNVLDTAYKLGIKRVICCLSTCVFPDGLDLLTEDNLHMGEPHESNFGYAYAKRIMEVQCRLYNTTAGFNYQCIIPTNIYGANDNFSLTDSHVIPGLIHKLYLHSLTNKNDTYYIHGDGTPLRQFIYSDDLAHIIVELVEKDILVDKLICSSQKEISILELAKMIGKEFGVKNVEPSQKIVENGQKSKTCSPKLLFNILPSLKLKPLNEGITETCYWFKTNYPNIRL
jgi:GDP-L-fucose synthase